MGFHITLKNAFHIQNTLAHPVTSTLFTEWKPSTGKHSFLMWTRSVQDMKHFIVGGYKEQSRQDKESYLWEPTLRTGCPNALLWCYFMSHLLAFRQFDFQPTERKSIWARRNDGKYGKIFYFLKKLPISKLHCGKESKDLWSLIRSTLIQLLFLNSSEQLEKKAASGFLFVLYFGNFKL